jgi:hypothetical protein
MDPYRRQQSLSPVVPSRKRTMTTVMLSEFLLWEASSIKLVCYFLEVLNRLDHGNSFQEKYITSGRVIDRSIASKEIFNNICRYLISDNIPESITSNGEEFKGAVNHLMIVTTKVIFRWLNWGTCL